MIEVCGFQEDFPWILDFPQNYKFCNNKVEYEYISFLTIYSLNFISFCTITKQLPFCQLLQYNSTQKGKEKKKEKN